MTRAETPNHNPDRPTLTCREVIDFVMAYLDGELDPSTRQDFERHLTVCPSCVNYLHGYKQTVRLGKVAMKQADEVAEGNFPEGLLRAIRAARSRNK